MRVLANTATLFFLTSFGVGVFAMQPESVVAEPASSGAVEHSSSRYVRGFQSRLKQLGYDNPVDGVFSPPLKDLLRRFQADRQLEVTGLLDRDTTTALLADPPQASDLVVVPLVEAPEPRVQPPIITLERAPELQALPKMPEQQVVATAIESAPYTPRSVEVTSTVELPANLDCPKAITGQFRLCRTRPEAQTISASQR